jgi:hypothetical protein
MKGHIGQAEREIPVLVYGYYVFPKPSVPGFPGSAAVGTSSECLVGTQRAKSFKPPTIDMRDRLSRASSNDLYNINFRSVEFDTREGEGIRQHVREVIIALWVQP